MKCIHHWLFHFLACVYTFTIWNCSQQLTEHLPYLEFLCNFWSNQEESGIKGINRSIFLLELQVVVGHFGIHGCTDHIYITYHLAVLLHQVFTHFLEVQRRHRLARTIIDFRLALQDLQNIANYCKSLTISKRFIFAIICKPRDFLILNLANNKWWTDIWIFYQCQHKQQGTF